MLRLESVAIALLGAVLGVVVGLAFALALQRSLADDGLDVLAVPGGQLVGFVARGRAWSGCSRRSGPAGARHGSTCCGPSRPNRVVAWMSSSAAERTCRTRCTWVGGRYVVDRAHVDDVAGGRRAAARRRARQPPGVGHRRRRPAPATSSAFEEIDADPRQLLVVVRRPDGRSSRTLQLTFLRTLSRRGGLRMQVEAVRVAGLGTWRRARAGLDGWAVDVGRAAVPCSPS